MASIPLILFSGMGADDRVFTPQREAFANLTVPRWITPGKNESLASYAERFARQIDPGGECFVGGASFGGFVAMEVARHLKARACFLIGSVRSPAELPLRIRALRGIRGATGVLPFEWVCGLTGVAVTASGSLSTPTTRVLLDQLSDSDAAFLRWATRAVLTWEPGMPVNIPILHIHGGCDRILPASCTHANELIPAGGHVISLSHPQEVNAFLRRGMERYWNA